MRTGQTKIEIEVDHSGLPPRRAFRFLHRKDLPALLSGSVRLGALSFYRPLEGRGDGRGDELENTETFHGDVHIEPGDETARQWCAERNIIIDPVHSYDWEGATFQVRGRDWFALCLSRSLSAWSSQMRRVENYDAVVEVVDIAELAAKLAYLNGNRPIIGRVRYTGVPKPVLAPADGPDPFVKRPKFSEEKEFRILLPRVDDEERTHLTIADPMLASHFREVRTPNQSSSRRTRKVQARRATRGL